MKTGYSVRSQRSDFGERLRALREAAGLNQRQVAAQLGISQPSYALWEIHNVALRSDQIERLARVLKISPEQLFGKATPKTRGGPVGKARRVFEQVSNLPRRQQQKIVEVVEAFVNQHANSKAA